MSNKVKVTVLGKEVEPISFWEKVLAYLPVEKARGKYTVKPRVVFITIGALVVSVATLHMILDEDRPNAVSAISAPDSQVNASLSQTVNVPPAASNQGSKPGDGKGGGPHSDGTGQRGKYSGPQVIARPKELGNIPPGSMLWARLETGASNGLVRAEVTEGLSIGGDQKIPAKTILVGTGSSGEERLFVHFSQAVFRDGSIGAISAEACDESDKIVGLKGSTVGNKALRLAGGIGLNFAGGFSEALQDSEGQQGATIRRPSLKNALLNGAATAALDQSKEMMSDLRSRPSVYEVPQHTRLCVIFGGGNQ